MMSACWPTWPGGGPGGARGRAAPGAGCVAGRAGHRPGRGAARLRRDLHDGLGPTLAGLMLGLETARTMPAGAPGWKNCSSWGTESQGAITDIRGIVYGLRPPALDELGLAGALQEEAARLERQAPGLSITLDIPAQWPGRPACGRRGGSFPDHHRSGHQRAPARPRAPLRDLGQVRPGPESGDRRRRHRHARGLAGWGSASPPCANASPNSAASWR